MQLGERAEPGSGCSQGCLWGRGQGEPGRLRESPRRLPGLWQGGRGGGETRSSPPGPGLCSPLPARPLLLILALGRHRRSMSSAHRGCTFRGDGSRRRRWQVAAVGAMAQRGPGRAPRRAPPAAGRAPAEPPARRRSCHPAAHTPAALAQAAPHVATSPPAGPSASPAKPPPWPCWALYSRGSSLGVSGGGRPLRQWGWQDVGLHGGDPATPQGPAKDVAASQ